MPLTAVEFGRESRPGRYVHDGAARLINAYPEDAGASSRNPFPLFACDGLAPFATLTGADGGVRAMLELDSTLYAVAGRQVYAVDAEGGATLIGGIPTSGPVTMARNRRDVGPQIAVVSDGLYYVIQGGVLSQINDTDLPAPSSVAAIDGYFVFAGLGSTWAISDLEGTGVDGLDFARAETSPDALVRAAVNYPDLCLFGSRSIEWWRNTGAPDFPFQRSSSLSIGCRATGAVAEVITASGSTLAFVAHDDTVRALNGYGAERISTHSVERSIAAEPVPSSITATSWTDRGHSFLAISGSSWSWQYDFSTGSWIERASHASSRWRVGHVQRFGALTIAGDATSGILYRMAYDVADEAGSPLVWTVQPPAISAWPYPLEFAEMRIDMVPGTGRLAGDNSPLLSVSWSQDGGVTFGASRQVPLGAEGDRRRRQKITRLGTSREDGRVFRLSCSAAVSRGIMGLAVDVQRTRST